MEPRVWKVAEATETTVLLVEDDDKLSTALGKFLETYSCRTVRAKNAVEGLRAIMYLDFDIIVCDMVMPTFPGDMFYRAVERVKPALCKRFLFMTGHRADPRWDTFIRQVGGLMLWKPFQMHELLTAMLPSRAT